MLFEVVFVVVVVFLVVRCSEDLGLIRLFIIRLIVSVVVDISRK